MSHVEKLDDEPIIIITAEGDVTPDMIQANRSAAMEQIAGIDRGPVVVIIDFRDAELDFANTMAILREDRADEREAFYEQAFTILVGSNQYLDVYRNAMQQPQYGSKELPAFPDMETALKAARVYLDRDGEN